MSGVISGYASGSAYQIGSSNPFLQNKKSFDALAQALNAGDLSGAQSAFAALSKNLPAGATTDADSPLSKIGTALQAGDVKAAKAVLPPPPPSGGPGGPGGPGGAPVAGAHGHHGHHRKGAGDGESQVAQLNSSIKSGDVAGTQDTLNKILDELKQLAALNTDTSSSSGSTSSSALSALVNAAKNLLNDPTLKNLQTAAAGGDAATIKTAWSAFLNNADTGTLAGASVDIKA